MNIARNVPGTRSLLCALVAGAVLTSACGQKEAVPPPAPGAAAPDAGAAAASAAGATGAAPAPAPPDATTPVAWRPDALDELLAPVALYPDALLGQLLAASVNPQEVLDGGNWLLKNTTLKGKALDQAAEQAGFGPAMRALFAFPEVVDMMCQNLDWTTQLGEAFAGDQAAVLDSVQRLRTRAVNAGTFASTPQQKVETQTVATADGAKKQVVVVEPADPKVVYVPKYDPVQAYQPIPEAQKASTKEESGPTTGDVVAAGIIGFGAGILISEIFDDDDDWDDYYRPSWGYGGVYYGGRPWYGNTYVYAPTYVGYRPAGGYYRPPNYPNRWDRPVNIGNVNVNVNNGNYFGRFPNNANRPNRPDGNRPGFDGGGVDRPGSAARQPLDGALADRAKVQGTYAGAKPGNGERPKIPTAAPKVPGQLEGRLPDRAAGQYAGAKDRVAQNRPDVNRPSRERPAADRPTTRPPPGMERPVGGATRDRLSVNASTRDYTRPMPDRGHARPAGDGFGGSASGARPAAGGADRMARPSADRMNRPAMQSGGSNRGGAFTGAGAHGGGGGHERAAAARGRASVGSDGGAPVRPTARAR